MEKVILTPRGLVLPEATTIDSKVLQDYKEGIASYGEKARQSLDIFSDIKGDLAGSNCFAPIELRKYLPKGTRLATMVDLGLATEQNPRFLSGFYSDTGLTLRTAGDSVKENDLLAKGLAKQLNKRGIKLKTPKIIYFDALSLKEDKDSAYGLVYVLNERAKLGKNIIDAPELTRDFQFRIANEKGIPVEDKEGNRTCYTRQDGLSGFSLHRGSYVNSRSRNLAASGGNGRVVAVKTSEAGSLETERYLQNLQRERDRQLAKIGEKYKQAERILRGQ